MHCSSCGTPNRDPRRFCGGCGSALGWVCPGCAFFNFADEQFCGGCGAPGQPGLVTAPAGKGEHRVVASPIPVAKASAPSLAPPSPPAPPGAAAQRSQVLAREVAAALEEQRRSAGETKQRVSQDEIDQLFRR